MIYLDSAATTKPLPSIKEKLPLWADSLFANPNSIYPEGQKARREIDRSRNYFSSVFKTEDNQIVFNSGATEGSNTVIKGLAEQYPDRRRIIVSPVEHKSVLMPAKQLVKKGFSVEFLKVDKNGIVDIDDLRNRLDRDVLVVCVMHVNNETGVIQPIKEIGALCREKGVPFFCDTVQSFGKIDVPYSLIDFFTISGHKINALKGTGLLKVSKKFSIEPLITGGGQEHGLRGGTENTTGIISLREASLFWEENKKFHMGRFYRLEELLIKKLKELIPEAKVVAEGKKVPYITTVLLPEVKGHDVVVALGRKGVAVSSGSACSSGSPQPSHVLLACGYGEGEALAGVRLSFGIDTDEEGVLKALEILSDSYRKIKKFKL